MEMALEYLILAFPLLLLSAGSAALGMALYRSSRRRRLLWVLGGAFLLLWAAGTGAIFAAGPYEHSEGHVLLVSLCTPLAILLLFGLYVLLGFGCCSAFRLTERGAPHRGRGWLILLLTYLASLPALAIGIGLASYYLARLSCAADGYDCLF